MVNSSDIMSYLKKIKNRVSGSSDSLSKKDTPDYFRGNHRQYRQEASEGTMPKVNLAILIPSYKREGWLCNAFLDNYYNMLIEPLRESLGDDSKVSLYLSVQNTSDEWKALIKEKITLLEGVSVEFTSIKPGTKISEIRCEMINRVSVLDSSVTHIAMSDDDLKVVSKDRIIGHFKDLLNSSEFRSGMTVFNAVPSREFMMEDIPTSDMLDMKRSLNLIRFQCFPMEAFLNLMSSDWFSKDTLYSVNNGEDAAISTLVFAGLYKTYGRKAGFKIISGFDEMIHLSEPTLKTHDIFSDRYQNYLKESLGDIPADFWSIYRGVIKDINEYGLVSSGFNRSTQNLNSLSYLSEIYPWIFDKWSIPSLSESNIKEFFNTVRVKDSIPNVPVLPKKDYKRSLEVSMEYLEGMVRLSLYYVYFFKEKNIEVSIEDIVRGYTLLLNHTDLNESAYLYEEVKLSARSSVVWGILLEGVSEDFYSTTSVEEFVGRALGRIKPYTFKRANRDSNYLESISYLDTKKQSMWGISKDLVNGEYAVLHVSNGFFPDSFLRYPEEVKRLLALAVQDASSKGAKDMICASWLNSCESFLTLFPDEYRSNSRLLSDFTPRLELGLWGQFIQKDMTVNGSAASYFIKSGKVAKPVLYRTSSILELKKHLGIH